MQQLISRDDPLQAVIEEENTRETARWAERILRAGTSQRAYTEQKRAVRQLIQWCEQEPETRRQVVRLVVSEV